MTVNRAWSDYQITYCAREMSQLANWMEFGLSGTVVGLPGTGKSNLLGFMSHRLDARRLYLKKTADSVFVIPIDLNNLPANNMATFYRVILRSFYEMRHQFSANLQDQIVNLYRENRASRDPFLTQSALREILFQVQAEKKRVVLVMDGFDLFCQQANPQLTRTLRGLRDSFKHVVSFIVGLRQEVIYLPDPTVLGDLYELLDTHVCWVHPMLPEDSAALILEQTFQSQAKPNENDIDLIGTVTGRYPSLLKTACHYWLTHQDTTSAEWDVNVLVSHPPFTHRLAEIWRGLTGEEQLVLTQVQKLQNMAEVADIKNQLNSQKQIGFIKAFEELDKKYAGTVYRLTKKGALAESPYGWSITGDLLAAYVEIVGGSSRGGLRFDERSNSFFQGNRELKLTPLERNLLHCLMRRPREIQDYSALIEATWPEETFDEELFFHKKESLQQLVRGLRLKIEPVPAKPCYIINHKGRGGGYQFFPEGRPE